MLLLNDYVNFMSRKSYRYYTRQVYPTVYNWWHSDDYYNLPNKDFYSLIKNAIKKAFTVGIGGDYNECGLVGEYDLGIIPSFDLPLKLIDQDSREMRICNHIYSNDHATHFIGIKDRYKEMNNIT